MGNSISVHQSFARDPSELDEIGVWVSQVIMCVPSPIACMASQKWLIWYSIFCCACDHSKHHNLGVFKMQCTT